MGRFNRREESELWNLMKTVLNSKIGVFQIRYLSAEV